MIKTNLKFLLLSLVVLTSCSKDETVQTSDFTTEEAIIREPLTPQQINQKNR